MPHNTQEAVLKAKDEDARDKAILVAVAEAIASAEGYANGDAASACAESAHKAMMAATVCVGTQGKDGLPEFIHSDVVNAAYNAASTALFARQNDGSGTLTCAVSAFEHANCADPACHLFATDDLRRLLTSSLGQYPDLGSPIDAGENGPLGPVWPGMKTLRKTESGQQLLEFGDSVRSRMKSYVAATIWRSITYLFVNDGVLHASAIVSQPVENH